ncbi:hypothetical protein [Borrelia persica]|uniref:hypothetical protein n=1 Tax=Borrelia persica TaxID=44448 RepID=UPI00046444C4|nr:hypothetical protein [Borrelia persica]
MIRQYILIALSLSNIISCGLLDKNTKIYTLETLKSNLDNGQKQALAFLQESLQNNEYLDQLKQKQKEYLDFLLKEKKENPPLKDKLQKTLNSKYDKNNLEQLFSELGNDKTKQFLTKLHITIESIKDGSFKSFQSANFRDIETEKQKEIALLNIKKELYTQYYFYTNGINTFDEFFNLIIDYIS